jgi:ThiF family protein
MSDRQRYVAVDDDEFYWERVKRNLGWLGDTEEEQRERQLKLKNAVIGVAGCGGIGGATADRLVRMGVQNLKLADPDKFEASNINRQFAATIGNIGRNKAEAVAEMVYETTEDVNIDVFPEGIEPGTVDEFVDGCDYILDKIELYELDARYTLHQAFRRSERCQFMMLTPVFGNRTFFFKWTKDSMTAEDYFGIPYGAPMNEANARQLISRFIPEMPDYPSAETLEKWFIKDLTCPIFGGTPPLAQGMLASRLGQAITGIDQLPGSVPLPVTPGYAMLDTQTWTAKTVEGTWWDR